MPKYLLKIRANKESAHSYIFSTYTSFDISAPGISLVDFDMPTNAACNNPSFDPNSPADGMITCNKTHVYSYIQTQDGDK